MPTIQRAPLRVFSCFFVAISWLPSHRAQAQTDAAPSPGILSSEFIYETAPFPQCHASTIEMTKDGLVTAWFGGTRERDPDVGIWLSRRVGPTVGWDKAAKAADGPPSGWTAPVELANGIQDDKKRHPCWNPVLFQMPAGPLLLFYKVGPSPSTWWGMLIKSDDAGRTWSKPEKLPDNIAGPIKNKPILLADGRLLCGSSTEDKGWRVHMEWTTDAGKTWDRTQPLCDGVDQGAIQPTIFRHSPLPLGEGGRGTPRSGEGAATPTRSVSEGRPEKLQMLCRNRTSGPLWQSWSLDAGRTWTKLELTDLPHPGSGIDGVTLADGRHLLVYNHTLRGRSPLNVALSADGKKWSAAAVLESQPGEYSYPAVIQTPDKLVHITYTWKRQRVKHITLDPTKLALKPIENSQWPQ